MHPTGHDTNNSAPYTFEGRIKFPTLCPSQDDLRSFSGPKQGTPPSHHQRSDVWICIGWVASFRAEERNHDTKPKHYHAFHT